MRTSSTGLGPRRPGRGFTLVEVLVVVTIVGLLIALLLPAVQAARESARRMACASNLRQLGVALHGHHATHGRFPPGCSEVQVDGQSVRHGWVVHILPYLDQGNLFNRYRLDESWDSSDNDDPAAPGPGRTFVSSLVCPSAPDRSGGVSPGNTRRPLDYPAVNDVVASAFLQPPVPSDPTFVGVLGNNVHRRLADIVDGSSNTLVLAECAGRNQLWVMGRYWYPNSAGGAWANPGAVNLAIRGSNPAIAATPVNNPTFDATPPPTGTMPGPCAVNCLNYQEIYAFHPGGANALFADGAVHFLKPNLDINIIAKLITRRGGEVLPSDN